MIALLPSLSLPVFLLNFPTSCNPFLSVCSARLAIYCDGVLRGEKGVAEDEATAKLTALMALFRLVAAKDVFEAFYKASLAKRLLSNKSQSFDLEVSACEWVSFLEAFKVLQENEIDTWISIYVVR